MTANYEEHSLLSQLEAEAIESPVQTNSEGSEEELPVLSREDEAHAATLARQLVEGLTDTEQASAIDDHEAHDLRAAVRDAQQQMTAAGGVTADPDSAEQDPTYADIDINICD